MKIKQKPAPLHDLFSAVQHEHRDDSIPDPPVRKLDENVTENFWDELQHILKLYREKNP